MKEAVYNHKYFLTAGECNACGRMPLTLLTERLIEVATEHANALGIGYARLVEHGIGWVLSRISVEMFRYPGINDTYSIDTWIESFTTRFSERNMCIRDADGTPIGYARTIWAPIDFKTRGLADLSHFKEGLPIAPEQECPIDKFPRIRLGDGAEKVAEYTFKYCDLDFNRHVNTVRYISLLLNQWTLQHFDENETARFDVAFARECYFGQTVSVMRVADEAGAQCELLREGEKVLSAAFKWRRIAGNETD